MMTRLSVGDRVTDLAGGREGRIVAIEGTVAYVVQPNGVEIEFALDKLKSWQEPEVKTVHVLSGPLRDKALSPAHRTLLASVPAELREAVARSYDSGADAGAPPFAALAEDKRLETIRIYLPTLPQRLLARHIKLVVAFRDLAKPRR